MPKTVEQIEVINIESRLKHNHGYVLKTKVVPDKDSTGHSIWSVEATNTMYGNVFVSQPIKTAHIPYERAYLEALRTIETQVRAFYEAKGQEY